LGTFTVGIIKDVSRQGGPDGLLALEKSSMKPIHPKANGTSTSHLLLAARHATFDDLLAAAVKPWPSQCRATGRSLPSNAGSMTSLAIHP
jgi:hypothetical protein